LQVFAASTPFHLKCGQCKARLRVHSAFEWSSLLLVVALGIMVGYTWLTSGLAEALPFIIAALVFEVVLGVLVARVLDLRLRD